MPRKLDELRGRAAAAQLRPRTKNGFVPIDLGRARAKLVFHWVVAAVVLFPAVLIVLGIIVLIFKISGYTPRGLITGLLRDVAIERLPDWIRTFCAWLLSAKLWSGLLGLAFGVSHVEWSAYSCQKTLPPKCDFKSWWKDAQKWLLGLFMFPLVLATVLGSGLYFALDQLAKIAIAGYLVGYLLANLRYDWKAPAFGDSNSSHTNSGTATILEEAVSVFSDKDDET